MITTIKYWLRYFLTICCMAAIIYMIACAVFVAILIINGDIKIHMIKDEHEDKKRNRNRKRR